MVTRNLISLIAVIFLMTIISAPLVTSAGDQSLPISDDTQICLSCHETVTPGIVADWKNSLHSMISPEAAMKIPEASRRISVKDLPAKLSKYVVGCAECHSLNTNLHKDSFMHNGYQIQVVLSPNDCAVCHPVERDQYMNNIMSHAYGNLMNNPVYKDLSNEVDSIEMFPIEADQKLIRSDSCLYCHGTIVRVESFAKRDTVMGQMEFPVFSGWPNQGVGRINPDGNIGSCTSCHPRHSMSIEIARSPEGCTECHTGPDVPAAKVYSVSKHGNIFNSVGKDWNMTNVPWVIGDDFKAPTCAVCHISGVVKPDGTVVAERTHRMNDRLANRLFGPILAIPHPKGPDTTIIKAPSGLPIPADLDGKLASEFLIDENEQKVRSDRMKTVCRSCHSYEWVKGHFDHLEISLKTTNDLVIATNMLLLESWEKGFAKGLDKGDSIFNDSIEKFWVEQWLFYANSTRFASAMAGADYGVFANGRWYMSKRIQEMKDWIEMKSEKK